MKKLVSVIDKISKIKKDKVSDIVTNFFGMIWDREINVPYCEENQEAIVFSVMENENENLYFYGNKEQVSNLLKNAPENGLIRIFTRNDKEDVEWLFQCGFTQRYVMHRAENLDMNQFKDVIPDERVQVAKLEEAEEIFRLLNENFDPIFAKAISFEELKERIKNHFIWSYREDSQIKGFMIAYSEGKKICLNFLLNKSKNIKGRRIQEKALYDAAHRGYQVAYLWVDSEYPAALKVHASFGFQHDGTRNILLKKN